MSINNPSVFDPNNLLLTDVAIKHFRNALNNRNSAKGVRFSVQESSGCSGYTYELDYVLKADKDDLIFQFQEIQVFIDPLSFEFLKGTKIDFETEGVNSGIKFRNPNVKAVCGCGESFDVDL